ncbi:hypothetical protein GCM10010912_14960 [Paenibacillus albidus]|uniref:Uncharacterized protein n=1 Tax=Paenibacillus albidus TaxID=2041023 RepID=A0A917FCN6_9BACL|nr:hypothetical protein [Paenibacillus albidus]GGF70753.1 hypothetical protein GCM10010912_14960 [Paenibacillus albidus]
MISVQPYYKVERVVTPLEQQTVTHYRTLQLYESKIVSAYREFPLSEVYDLSFKRIGENPGHGVLYLHAKQGVFPYMVEKDPANFINEFMNLMKKSAPGKGSGFL